MKTFIFYDKNSKDANLSQFVNRLMFGFTAISVETNTDTTNTNFEFHNPATIYDGADVCVFVGCKPSLAFCNKQINSETKIYIIDKGVTTNFYSNVLCFVEVVAISTITLSKTFHQLMLLLTVNDIVDTYTTSNETRIKIADMINLYEQYNSMFQSHIIDDKKLSIKNYVDGFVYSNKISDDILDVFKNNPLPSKSEGISQLKTIQLIVWELMTKSIISVYPIGNETVKILKICADEKTINLVDKQLTDYLKSDENLIPFDVIEYYQINSDSTVSVKAKHVSTYLSQTEIKNDIELANYIGETENLIIDNYLLNKYLNIDYVNNFDASKSISTTLTNYFT